MDRQNFTVSDMNCNGCVSTIRQGLEADGRIKSVDINLSKKLVSVKGDLTPEQTAEIIRNVGFKPEIGVEKKSFFGNLFSN